MADELNTEITEDGKTKTDSENLDNKKTEKTVWTAEEHQSEVNRVIAKGKKTLENKLKDHYKLSSEDINNQLKDVKTENESLVKMINSFLDIRKANLDESYKELLDGKSPLEQITWLDKNEAKYRKDKKNIPDNPESNAKGVNSGKFNPLYKINI